MTSESSTPASPPPPGEAEHYSYRVYADPSMADGFETLRFSGPIGSLLAEDQARVLADFLGEVTGLPVLDVGTGTGRAAFALARRGATVTGVDASGEMLRVASARAVQSGVAVTFERGDAHHLPFADRTFHAAVSLRVLMHTPDWRVCLRELCRVSSHRVVFDYPPARSAAALQSWGRRALAAMGSRTEAYRVLRDRSVVEVLEASGFAVERMHRQFVLPIVLHKAIGSRAVTRAVEQGFATMGLLNLFGSPVTIVAVRCGS
jgi:SAM-dependent methyltransferase